MPSSNQIVEKWNAWDSFLEAIPETGFMQSSWWADFRSTVGFEHFAAILKNQGSILGGALAQKYFSSDDNIFYYIQDGPVLPGDESDAAQVFRALLISLENRRKTEPCPVSHLRIEPRWEQVPSFVEGFQPITHKGDRFLEPRNTLCIDLRLSEEEILAQMKPKGRYNIRVAQKHGVSVVEDNTEQGLHDFLQIYNDMADRQRLNAKPPEYFQVLVAVLRAYEKGSLFFAEYQGKRLAAALTIYFGKRATYFYGGSLEEHRNVMAPYLLHFEVMRRAKALGCEWYDLWGISPPNEPNHPWNNITIFKRKFGGTDVRLVPTLDFVYDMDAYEKYITEREPQEVLA